MTRTSALRSIEFAVWVTLALFVAGGAAHGHGGNFKVPGGGGDPGTGVPGTPGPPVPGVPTVTPPSAPVPGRVPPSSRTPLQPGTWQMWWQLNCESLLPERSALTAAGVVTPSSPVFQVGRASVGAAAPLWNPAAERGASDLALPYLLSLLDRRTNAPDEMVSTALVAVGRIARESPPIALIQSWAIDRRSSLEVREAAVLALGLLRRSERERQLPTEKLCRIRDFLLMLFDDEKNPTRVRAFALLSLALLADQPYEACTIATDGRLVTRALWMRLERRKYKSQELTIALLTAIGHQPRSGVPSSIHQRLCDIARGRPVFRRSWDAMERSHAVTAVARLGGEDVTTFLVNRLRDTREDDAVQSAVLIGLSGRAASMTPDERVFVAQSLRKFVNLDRHWLVRGLSYIAMGTLLGTDLRESSHAVLARTDVAEFLWRKARKGSSITRPYAVVGYGLSAHDVPHWSRPAAKHLVRVRDTCAWGLRWARGSDLVVGAYAVAAGLSRSEASYPLLVDILADKNREQTLRGHCALAIAQIGRDTDEAIELLLAATRERVSPFVHVQAVRALSLLGADGTREELLKQLRGRRSSRPALIAVAGALGRVQDPEAALTLLDLARDRNASRGVRVAAVMALGLTFDPEARPSRVRLTTHANYPSMTWSLAQVFNIV